MKGRVAIAYTATKVLQTVAVNWIFVTYVLFLEKRGYTLFHANLLNTAFMTTMFLVTPFAGRLADKVGYWKVYFLGLVGWGGGMVVYSRGYLFREFLIAEALAGIGSAMMANSLDPWLYNEIHDDASRKRIKGIAAFLSQIAGIFPAMKGIQIAEQRGYQWPWILGACSVVPVGLLAILGIRLFPQGKSRGKKPISVRMALREVMVNPTLRFCFLTDLVYQAATQPFNMFWSSIVAGVAGKNWLANIPLGVAAFGGLGGIAVAMGGTIFSGGKGLALVLATTGLPMSIPAVLPTRWPIVLAFLSHEAGRGAWDPFFQTFKNHHIESDESRATLNATTNLANTIGRAIGLLVSGWLTTIISPLEVWRISALALVTFSLLAWRRK